MKKTNITLLLSFLFVFFATAQSKDSIHFYKMYHDVPVKYKLEHFGLHGKVKSFYEMTLPENEDNEKIIYEFDQKGNILQIKNSYGFVTQEFNYDAHGRLLSYTTNKKIKRDFKVTLNKDGNVSQLILNNKDYGISTIVNEYNKKGYWTSQKRKEDNNLLLENIYENDSKLKETKIYNNNEISERTKFNYTFFKDFVQIKLTSIYEELESYTYIYVDYYNNQIYGFPFDEENITEAQIKEVLYDFKIDHNNNWVKNQEVVRVIAYY